MHAINYLTYLSTLNKVGEKHLKVASAIKTVMLAAIANHILNLVALCD